MKRARNAKRARWGSGTHQGTPAEFARAAHTCSVATTISTMKAEAISPMFCDGAAAARFSRAFATGGSGSPRRRIALRTMATCAPELRTSAEPCCKMKSYARAVARVRGERAREGAEEERESARARAHRPGRCAVRAEEERRLRELHTEEERGQRQNK